MTKSIYLYLAVVVFISTSFAAITFIDVPQIDFSAGTQMINMTVNGTLLWQLIILPPNKDVQLIDGNNNLTVQSLNVTFLNDFTILGTIFGGSPVKFGDDVTVAGDGTFNNINLLNGDTAGNFNISGNLTVEGLCNNGMGFDFCQPEGGNVSASGNPNEIAFFQNVTSIVSEINFTVNGSRLQLGNFHSNEINIDGSDTEFDFIITTQPNPGSRSTLALGRAADQNGRSPMLDFFRAEGSEFESPLIVQSGTNLGEIRFFGFDGTTFIPGAAIVGDMDGTPGLSDMPGRIDFFTTPNGGDSLVKAVTIAENGFTGFNDPSPTSTVDIDGTFRLQNLDVGEIVSGEITYLQSFMTIDTEGGSSSDELDTINGGSTGDILILQSTDNGNDITLEDDVDNLRLDSNFDLANVDDKIMLINVAGEWHELSRSQNN